MEYRVLYEINYFNMQFATYLLLVFATGCTIAFFVDKTRKRWFYLFPITLAWLMGLTTVAMQFFHADDLRDGRCQAVQGQVRDFEPASSKVKHEEQFKVEGVSFLYSPNELRAGLSHSLAKQGLKNGVYARVYYKDGDILKIEIKQ